MRRYTFGVERKQQAIKLLAYRFSKLSPLYSYDFLNLSQSTKIGFDCLFLPSFQFSTEEPRRAMITSEDSKVRLFDGIDVIHKYKGDNIM